MSVSASSAPTLSRPTTVEEAVTELERLGESGAPLAGATWVMRGPLRGEQLLAHYVALTGIDELRRVEPGDPTVLGALLTHTELGQLIAGTGPLGSLAEAARSSAFPAVRNAATLAGNLCASPFPEADLVPALLAGDAELELATSSGRRRLPVAEWVGTRAGRPPGELITHVAIPAPRGRRSWFERLTVRAGGEYAVASVAVSVDLGADGRVSAARVAVGSVGEIPQRSPAAEEALAGKKLDERAGEEAGRAAAAGIEPRDSVSAPGWYRLEVLPALVRRAAGRIAATAGEESA